ncbi:MAG: calcium-translocating P-type ATPase, PMCA-type [Clostridia bacterium]|nr:calcium-translocating P-type ATPase, PMCA-type [Clostridia bacterium]
MDFYTLTKQETVKQTQSSLTGLTEHEAQKRLQKNGKNELKDTEQKGLIAVFLSQFKDFLVIILIIAAVISMFLGDIESSVVILAVITVNAILGTVQELKAQASLNSLKAMSSPSAKVYRDGQLRVIDKSDLVVGDVVLVEAGDYIAADGRILDNASLKSDESSLTGESVPVEKEDTDIHEEKPLGDRKNMLYSGSFATYGRATILVTAIGMQTEIGKIATLLQNTKEKKTPLQASLDNFGKVLSIGILFICALVFMLSVFRGEPMQDAFIFAVALAVAAIPEALSSIVTIVLSGGTQKLARENAIIRKLQAVEGLGSVSVICSDKTGTLTQNKMSVQKLFFDGEIVDKDATLTERQAQLVIDGALCNDAKDKDGQEIGDPTEVALIQFSNKHNLHYEEVQTKYPRLAEIPFDSHRKLMSTVHKIGPNYKMLTKGATDVLLPRILEMKTADGKKTFTAEDAEKVMQANLTFSENGLRVLCVCEKDVPDLNITVEDENGYILLGLIAMQDPPRAESKDAVAKCKSAGITPVMITGDHLITACAIAKEIGILTDDKRGVEGKEIEKMTDEELKDFVKDVAVYARVSPEHKIRIVNAWQSSGYIVSMTGDGVNDAPALKQADVGVAMGITGSEVAKDAASMVLTDDNFATIVKAIENGRNIYNNIQKTIQFLLSGNLAAIITVLFASLCALPVPFMAVHLLFINLLTDSLPAIALGVEPHNDAVMLEKPRPKKQSILTKKILASIGLEGFVISVATIVAYLFGLQSSPETASTMAFATLCLSRLFHGFNCKQDMPLWFSKKLLNNKSLLYAFGIGLLCLNAVLFIPFLHGIFEVSTLKTVEVLCIYGFAFGTFLVIQLLKSVRKILKK